MLLCLVLVIRYCPCHQCLSDRIAFRHSHAECSAVCLIAVKPMLTCSQGTVYECKPKGIIEELQAYCDTNVSYSKQTMSKLLVVLFHHAGLIAKSLVSFTPTHPPTRKACKGLDLQCFLTCMCMLERLCSLFSVRSQHFHGTKL